MFWSVIAMVTFFSRGLELEHRKEKKETPPDSSPTGTRRDRAFAQKYGKKASFVAWRPGVCCIWVLGLSCTIFPDQTTRDS